MFVCILLASSDRSHQTVVRSEQDTLIHQPDLDSSHHMPAKSGQVAPHVSQIKTADICIGAGGGGQYSKFVGVAI